MIRAGRRSSAMSTLLVSCVLAVMLAAGCTPEVGNPNATSSTGDDVPATVAPSPAPEPETAALDPTSSQLIAAALEAGEIDRPTSLLYRTWQYFGDPLLPNEFVGAPEAYDLGLILELRQSLADLPDDVRVQIEPYLKRPSDPESAFSAGADDGPEILSSSVSPLLGASGPTGQLLGASGPTDQRQQCSGNWAPDTVQGLPFKVWVCLDSDIYGERSPGFALAVVKSAISAHAEKMIDDMGEPIRDDPESADHAGSDDLIDVYVLPQGWLGPDRDGRSFEVSGGRSVGTPPFDGATASAYVLIDAHFLGDYFLRDPGYIERMVVHELFHVLQYAHHARLSERWYYDASAEWAASYYVRDDSAPLHRRWLPVAQNNTILSLTSEAGEMPYAAYLWPLFMEQEEGADAVFASWRTLGKASKDMSDGTVIDAINQEIDIEGKFADFSMRVFNAALAGDPIRPRFVNLDTQFPDGDLPKLPKVTLKEQPEEIDYEMRTGLSYAFHEVEVVPPAGTPSGNGVLVNVSGLVSTDSGKTPTLEAVVRGPDGDYRRKLISYVGDGTDVCVNEEMFLVFSNTSKDFIDIADGVIEMRIIEGKPCTRVEVAHPEFLHRLSDGEDVHVKGTEGDGEPEDTRLVVNVHDANPEMADTFQVQVTVTGGTLSAARELTWPLTDFDNLADHEWRKIVDLRLDHDLTDTNRPLTIDARLTREGDDLDQHSPTIILHADQESQCFADVTITGHVMHRIQLSGAGEIENRSYPVDLAGRFQPPQGADVTTIDSYEQTSLQIYNDNPSAELDGGDLFHFTSQTFGQSVPVGETGSFTLDADLVYRDYENAPWMLWDEDKPLPNRGYGIPQDALTMMDGHVKIDVTNNLIDKHVLENWGETTVGHLAGTVSGTFTDDDGSRVNFEATFEHSSDC